MSLPVFSSLFNTFGGAASVPLFSATHGIATSYIDALILPLKYEVAQQHRTLLPNPADLLGPMFDGFINRDGYDWLAAFHNIPNLGDKQNPFQAFGGKAWDALIKSKIPRLTIDQVLYAAFAGIITKDRCNTLLKEYGFRKDQLDVLQGIIGPKFDQNILINNYFRGSNSYQETVDKMRRFYGCNQNSAETILDNSQFIPPPGDLIRFAVKGVYNPDEIKEFELDAEFDEIKEGVAWANATGIGEATIKDKDGNVITKDIFKDYWMAHWQLMSPQQGFESLHRLRPSRLSRYTDRVPDLTPFEFKQLNVLLKAQDYVPKQRKWLAAISYNQLGRIDLRRLFLNEIIDETELVEQYQDLGYVSADAYLLLEYSIKDKKEKDKLKKEKEAKSTYGKLAAQIYLAYRDGAIGRDLAYARLMLIFDDDSLVTANIDAIDIDINRHRVLQYIKMVKDEFFLGLYDGVQAVAELLQGGVNDIRASQYVIRWQRQLSRPRRIASINTILDWYKRILITFDDAAARLSNLGVSNNETLLYLQAGSQDIQKALIQEQNKQARTEKQKVEESKRLLRELQANHRSAKSDLRTYSNINDMKRWFLTGLIEEYEVRERMNFLDIPILDQDRIITEWKG